MTDNEMIDVLNDEARSYLHVIQQIAEMVGLDTRNEPAEGTNDVLEAVESFVLRAQAANPSIGGTTRQGAAQRMGEHWQREAVNRWTPEQDAHAAGVKAYLAAAGVVSK